MKKILPFLSLLVVGCVQEPDINTLSDRESQDAVPLAHPPTENHIKIPDSFTDVSQCVQRDDVCGEQGVGYSLTCDEICALADRPCVPVDGVAGRFTDPGNCIVGGSLHCEDILCFEDELVEVPTCDTSIPELSIFNCFCEDSCQG